MLGLFNGTLTLSVHDFQRDLFCGHFSPPSRRLQIERSNDSSTAISRFHIRCPTNLLSLKVSVRNNCQSMNSW
jgi:hypothetical protein